MDTFHSTRDVEVLQPERRTFLVSSIDAVHDLIRTCPRAQTGTAWSWEFKRYVVVSIACKTWSCPKCSRAKIARLAHGVRLAKPNRLMTLTVDPSLHPDPRTAFVTTSRKIPRIIHALRKRFGEVEYLRVTEITKAGWPHYHFLIRSGYLPHKTVQTLWQDLTGARIVDIRQVKKSFSAYYYVVKYLSKMHKLSWTERHVSVSRHFIPPEAESDFTREPLEDLEVIPQHPARYIAAQFPGRLMDELRPGCWAVSHFRSATVEPPKRTAWRPPLYLPGVFDAE